MLGNINDQCFRIIILLLIFIGNINAEYNELKMVHVIFRHGERTPTGISASERYPKDPYLNDTFFPIGNGGLTNEGKLSMYTLGTFLRGQYDNFLGDFYYPGISRVRATEMSRSRMSAQLVNAGLWPPAEAQRWKKDLPWIPIPDEYVKSDTDSLMLSYKCPTYKAEYERVLQTDEVQKLIKPHLDFFDYLSKHSGENITRPKQVFFLYHTLNSQESCNLSIPSWTEGYYPDGEMWEVAQLEYDISTWGDILKRIYGGPLLHDILQDYKNLINGTFPEKSSPKITLYSGHESNIVSVLNTLGLWTPHVPDFSSALLFELHLNNSTNDFGIQILYYLGKTGETIPLTLPGCTRICPVNEFTKLLSNMIPDDVDEICGMKIESGENRSSFVSLQTNFYITVQIWILFKII